MLSGRVKWFDATKGYGFIEIDHGGDDAFVHATDVQRAGLDGLKVGQRILFDLGTNMKTGRPKAINLTVQKE